MEMSILLPEAHKFLVVILYTSSAEEVATVSENWRVDQDVMFYPNFKGPKLEKAVRSHQTPDSNWPSYPYMLLKICDDWKVARGWEKRALNPDSDLLTSDVEKPKKRRSLPPRRFSPTMEKRSITNGPSTSTQKCAISSEEDGDSSPDETIEDTLPALDEDLESENEVTTLRESPVQSQGKSAAEKKTNEINIAKANAAKSNLLKTNAAKVNATKTNAVNTVAEKPVTAKASANKSRHLNNLAKTVFSKIFNTQKDGVETISRFKQPLGIKPLSPLRDMNHQLPAPMSSSVSSHQHVAASPGSKRRLYVDSNTSSSLKKPAIAQESSFDKNVSRLTLKKSCEILECVNRVEQKIDRLLAFQDNQHIEDLFDEVMKLPVDDLDSWQMLEDLLMDKRNCIKLVSKYSTLGGSDLGDFVRRIWAALVTDKFGCELSWIGRDKKKIAVKGSNCFSLVVRTVKANIKYADVNDPDIEKASQDWIFKSKRRVQRAEDTSNVVESCVPSLSDSPVAGTSGCNRSTVSNI